MDNFSALIQLMNPDNTMSVNRYLAHSMGMAETIIYSALISKYTYYRDNGKASDGWFYSTIEDLQESTTYGRKVQTSAINNLMGYGLLESKLMGMPAKRYFRLVSDTDKLAALIEQGQKICMGMRRKNETAAAESTETAQNSRLSEGANKIVPMGQTRLSQTDKQDCPNGTNKVAPMGQASLSQTDKQDCPDRTNKIVPMGQAYINLKGNNLKGNNLNLNQSIAPEEKNFAQENFFGDEMDRIDRTDRKPAKEIFSERKNCLERVKTNISFDILKEKYSDCGELADEIAEIITDVIMGLRKVYVSGKIIPERLAAEKFLRLEYEHAEYVINSISELDHEICKPDAYICTALYNALFTLNISTFAGFTANTGMRL